MAGLPLEVGKVDVSAGDALHDAVEVARSDLGRIASRVDELAQNWRTHPPSDVELYGAGALLHGYYNALERLLERFARDLNGGPPSGQEWHRLLLRSMALDKPQVRPAVFDLATVERLGPYLRFRHRFRHLYVLDLRAVELASLLEELTEVHGSVDRCLAEFAAALVKVP
jgi:hypothetical protein